MQIRDLNGNIVKWTPKGTGSKDTRAKSSLHERAREILKEKYPTLRILEEISIPVRPRQLYYLDFYSTLHRRAYEVHGEQHYKYNNHFHASVSSFISQKNRDKEKARWCEQNNIELIVLPYNTQETWKDLV